MRDDEGSVEANEGPGSFCDLTCPKMGMGLSGICIMLAAPPGEQTDPIIVNKSG